MASEYIIWSVPCGRRVRIGASDASVSPIPFGAEPITRVESCDLRIMLRWCRRRARRGWTVEKMRAACDD